MTIDEAIRMEETIVKDNERYVNLTRSNYAMPGTDKRKKEEKRVGECEEVIEEHRQLAEWLKELKEIKDVINAEGTWITDEDGDIMHVYLYEDFKEWQEE